VYYNPVALCVVVIQVLDVRTSERKSAKFAERKLFNNRKLHGRD